MKEWFLWTQCWEGWHSTLMPTSGCRQNSAYVWTIFTSQEANRNLASAWQYKAAHKFVEVGSHHKIWADSVTPSTLLPQSSSLRFTHIYSSESFSPQYKVWDQGWCDLHSENLAMWTGQGMISKRHTHSCSLVEGHRSGWKLCGKTGYGVKPSLFINV